MPIDGHKLNQFALLLLDTVPPDGMPEFVVAMSYDQVGLGTFSEGREMVRHLVLAGILARAPGPRIVPGPEFETLKTEVERARAEAGRTADGGAA